MPYLSRKRHPWPVAAIQRVLCAVLMAVLLLRLQRDRGYVRVLRAHSRQRPLRSHLPFGLLGNDRHQHTDYLGVFQAERSASTRSNRDRVGDGVGNFLGSKDRVPHGCIRYAMRTPSSQPAGDILAYMDL